MHVRYNLQRNNAKYKKHVDTHMKTKPFEDGGQVTGPIEDGVLSQRYIQQVQCDGNYDILDTNKFWR